MSILGIIVNGYQFLEFIDSGSFGSVYKASKDGKSFAIKIFREDYVLKQYREKGELNRINREIQIMKSVDHPNLIKYIDDFKEILLGVPSYFLVMEYAEGLTLDHYIKEEKLTTELVKDIFIKMLYGIQALHTIRGEDNEKGIIHRDLKPQNIIIEKNRGIKIIDYGLSKIIDYTSITTTGSVMGSPAYMSPEQIRDSKYIDKRSDLYTLGVILYEMITNKFPYEFTSLPDLYEKILTAKPIPPRRWKPLLENKFENIILKLLEKEPFKRYSTINELIEVFISVESDSVAKSYDLTPRFFLRLYNEKSVLEEFVADGDVRMYVEFPANHQVQQKGLLKMVNGDQFTTLIDPATMRLAYPAQGDVKGLQSLPYAPPKFTVITPEYLGSSEMQQQYVKQVIDEQVRLGGDVLISPYHYIHNTNVPATRRRNPVDEWFDLDIKLLKESIDYRASVKEYLNKPLFAGICLNGDSLLDKTHTTDLLNLFSAFDCDGFFIYVDCIDNNTSGSILYHYIKTLSTLQKHTGKPVIAGRINSIGLGLLCCGITGFSSGAARFDSFYEDLYKEETEAFNLYERFYLPELLSTISVDRRSPVKLAAIMDIMGSCNCYYCNNKSYIDLVKSKNSKLHFLEVIHTEVEKIKQQHELDRISYFLGRIDNAIDNYKRLTGIFKPKDYQYLTTWKEVFKELHKEVDYF